MIHVYHLYRHLTVSVNHITRMMLAHVISSFNSFRRMIDVYHLYHHLAVSVDSFIVDMRLIRFDGRVQVVSADDRGSVIYRLSTGDRSILSLRTCACFRFVCEETYGTNFYQGKEKPRDKR